MRTMNPLSHNRFVTFCKALLIISCRWRHDRHCFSDCSTFHIYQKCIQIWDIDWVNLSIISPLYLLEGSYSYQLQKSEPQCQAIVALEVFDHDKDEALNKDILRHPTQPLGNLHCSYWRLLGVSSDKLDRS